MTTMTQNNSGKVNLEEMSTEQLEMLHTKLSSANNELDATAQYCLLDAMLANVANLLRARYRELEPATLAA